MFPGPGCNTSECRLRLILSGKTKVKSQITGKRGDGATISCVVVAAPVYTTSGELSGIVETFQDVTELQIINEQIRESEERYRILIELGNRVGEAVIMLGNQKGKEGVHVFTSDQWTNITGYSKEELRQISFFDLVSCKDRRMAVKRHLAKMSGINLPGLFELSIVRKDGQEVPVELTSGSSVFMGQPVNIAYVRDVTERKKQEQLLRQTNTLYSATLNLTSNIITVIDRNYNRVLVNDTACQFHGKSRSQLLGIRFDQMVHPDDLKPTIDAIERMKKTGETIKGLVNRVYTDRGLKLVEWDCCPFYDDDNNFDGWQANGRDITESRALEEEKHQRHLKR